MKIIRTRKDIVHFSQMVKGNEGKDIGKEEVKILTVQCSGFTNKQEFASSEYVYDGIVRDVVKINNRYLVVGKSSCGKNEWLSITLPSDCNVNFPKKKYELYVTRCPITGKEKISNTLEPHCLIIKKIKVQEIKN